MESHAGTLHRHLLFEVASIDNRDTLLLLLLCVLPVWKFKKNVLDTTGTARCRFSLTQVMQDQDQDQAANALEKQMTQIKLARSEIEEPFRELVRQKRQEITVVRQEMQFRVADLTQEIDRLQQEVIDLYATRRDSRPALNYNCCTQGGVD